MLWYCVNKYQIYIPLHLWQYLSWNYTEELCWCHIPLLGTAVTVPPERQLPFQNGSYRSRTAYAMVCQWSRWHMPQAIKRSRRLSLFFTTMLKVIFSTEVVGACSGEKTKENEIHVCRLSLLRSTTFILWLHLLFCHYPICKGLQSITSLPEL